MQVTQVAALASDTEPPPAQQRSQLQLKESQNARVVVQQPSLSAAICYLYLATLRSQLIGGVPSLPLVRLRWAETINTAFNPDSGGSPRFATIPLLGTRWGCPAPPGASLPVGGPREIQWFHPAPWAGVGASPPAAPSGACGASERPPHSTRRATCPAPREIPSPAQASPSATPAPKPTG